MSRFVDDYDEWFPNQALMWEANLFRSLSGRKGQQALRDLEQALLKLAEPRLISGHLAHNGQVCAVGALVAHRRCAAGEERNAVLADLDRRIKTECETCGHVEESHVDGGCLGCARWTGRQCGEFIDSGYANDPADLTTAYVGMEVGLTMTLAYHLGYLNDDTWHLGTRTQETAEERYDRVLAWTRARIIPSH